MKFKHLKVFFTILFFGYWISPITSQESQKSQNVVKYELAYDLAYCQKSNLSIKTGTGLSSIQNCANAVSSTSICQNGFFAYFYNKNEVKNIPL